MSGLIKALKKLSENPQLLFGFKDKEVRFWCEKFTGQNWIPALPPYIHTLTQFIDSWHKLNEELYVKGFDSCYITEHINVYNSKIHVLVLTEYPTNDY